MWRSLDNESKKTWDTLSDKSKAIILGIDLKSSTDNRERTPRKANFHDMDTADLIALLHEREESDALTLTDTALTDPSTSDSATTLLAHLTERKKADPGDIRHALSSTLARLPKGKKDDSTKDSITVDGKEYRQVEKSKQVMINGKDYRQVNETRVVYDVSKRERKRRNGSLMDRGANGGVAGDDV